MSEGNMTAGDYALLSNGGMNGNYMWNNPFMYLIWMSMFKNGAFGNDCGPQSAAMVDAINNQGTMTRQAIDNGFNFQDNMNGIRDVYQATRDTHDTVQGVGYTLSSQLCKNANDINATTVATGTNIKDAIICGDAGIKEAVTNSTFAQQLNSCQINHNIDALKYENAKNTCDITNAIHNEGETTRAMITANKLDQLRTDLQSAQLTLANANQTQNILNAMGRYVTYQGCGCNCPATTGW